MRATFSGEGLQFSLLEVAIVLNTTNLPQFNSRLIVQVQVVVIVTFWESQKSFT